MDKRIEHRFAELKEQLEKIAETEHVEHTEMMGPLRYVDEEALLSWQVKARNLLSRACGKDSEHYREFLDSEDPRGMGETNADILKRLRAVFSAATEDYAGGHLASLRSLVQAEVFESELEQARELFGGGYHAAAAVIAGVVLETGLRELCDRAGLPHGKLDKMNADLAKAGTYNKLQQKRITALADIRNSAAHGRNDQFSPSDVDAMIRDVEQFLAQGLGS